MTSSADALPPSRMDLVARSEAMISAGSKSFRFASRLFDRETRERSWLLYAWCRACDDLADGQTLGHQAVAPADPQARIAFIRSLTERALAGEATNEPPFDALAVVANECAIPRRLIDDHVAGFALDAEGWQPQSEADLLRYCYHVAGAVGCMMALVMGISPDDEPTLASAADLGIAFQLANIARDLVEDAAVGRFYVPGDWLAEEGLEQETLAEPRHREALARIAARFATLERRYRASARSGAAQLPFRARWAVLAAAGIYGAIAEEVARLGPKAWDQRVSTSKSEKLRHVISAWVQAVQRDGTASLSRPTRAPPEP
jgi:phytoene synthase